MNLMQYEIALPADYDMAIIRERVATRGSLLDDFDGLAMKAYCVRERGIDGSPVNAYAPFYLWHTTAGMNRFLFGGGGFEGLVATFGRPAIAHWIGLAAEPGPARAATPQAATRRLDRLAPDADAPGAVARALDELREEAARPGVHTAALGIDPRRWELVRFTLWAAGEHAADEVAYRVLHLSAPQSAASA